MKFTLRQIQVFVAVARAENVPRRREPRIVAVGGERGARRAGESVRAAALRPPRQAPAPERAGQPVAAACGGAARPRRRVRGACAASRAFARQRVGATLTIGNYLLPLIVSDFQAHPESRVVCRCATPRPSPSACCTTRSTWPGRGQVVDAELHVEPWVEDELVVFCAPGMRSPHAVARADELAGSRGSCASVARARARPSIARHHLAGFVPRLELEHTEAIKRGVESGLAWVACRGWEAARCLPARQPGGGGGARARPAPAFQLRLASRKYHGAALRFCSGGLPRLQCRCPPQRRDPPPPVV